MAYRLSGLLNAKLILVENNMGGLGMFTYLQRELA